MRFTVRTPSGASGALRRVGQGAVEPLRRDEAENGVAEEFEALVIDRVWAAHLERRRSKRLVEKRGVLEGVPEYFHDGHLCVLSASARDTCEVLD